MLAALMSLCVRPRLESFPSRSNSALKMTMSLNPLYRSLPRSSVLLQQCGREGDNKSSVKVGFGG